MKTLLFDFLTLANFKELKKSVLFFWTSLLTGLAFFLVGWLKSSVNQTSALRGISETVLLGLLAAVVAYFVGDVLEQFFG